MSGQPHVLFVDDEPDRLNGLRTQLEASGITTAASHPIDLEPEDLHGVHLVSVDQFLGDDWTEYLLSDERGEEPLSAATRASDGIAVAASINSLLRQRDRPCALSLHTAEIDRLGASLPAARREPLLAAQYDLDWVFRFDGSKASALPQRMTSLAQAVAVLPEEWSANANDFGAAWLTVPQDNTPWSEFALAQVEDCRPPTHGLSANTKGRAVVRWLAQRVLPYPTFLINVAHLAVLLGATAKSTEQHLDTFLFANYAGPLRDFAAERWWRAGVQHLLEECGTSEADDPATRVTSLNAALGTDLSPLNLDRPVVGYDENGRALDTPIESNEAVRLQPDGWPVYADDPWATRGEASANDALRALVVHAERDLLGE